jgi:hypothetical protein
MDRPAGLRSLGTKLTLLGAAAKPAAIQVRPYRLRCGQRGDCNDPRLFDYHSFRSRESAKGNASSNSDAQA